MIIVTRNTHPGEHITPAIRWVAPRKYEAGTEVAHGFARTFKGSGEFFTTIREAAERAAQL